MKKIAAFCKRNTFLLLLLLFFLVLEMVLTCLHPLKNWDIFWRNDFELTQLAHPEEVWDKVFFGNSVVISGYVEEESESGYINLGLDYGVVTDLWEMIDGGDITLGSELVIGLNWLTLYDEFDTNPTYIWHKKWYEPYLYFERDRIYQLFTEGFDRVLRGEPFIEKHNADQQKAVYHGNLSDEELAEKAAIYDELYWHVGIDKFDENWAALENVFQYCEENGVRVRVLWMPWNPKAEVPPLVLEVKDKTEALCLRYGVETKDMMAALDASCFYDLGHLDYDHGARVFTEEVDKWLIS